MSFRMSRTKSDDTISLDWCYQHHTWYVGNNCHECEKETTLNEHKTEINLLKERIQELETEALDLEERIRGN